MVKSVVLECETCGKKFLSTGETKCIVCDGDKLEEETPEKDD